MISEESIESQNFGNPTESIDYSDENTDTDDDEIDIDAIADSPTNQFALISSSQQSEASDNESFRPYLGSDLEDNDSDYSDEENEDSDRNESDRSDNAGSDSEYDLNDGCDIVRQITEEFQQMKAKLNQEENEENDIDVKCTTTRQINGSQKYKGSSTDTNNENSIKNTFEVEVCIENPPKQNSVETVDKSQTETGKNETNVVIEDVSDNEINNEDSSSTEEDETENEADEVEDEEDDDQDNENNVETEVIQNGNENSSESDEEDENENEDSEEEEEEELLENSQKSHHEEKKDDNETENIKNDSETEDAKDENSPKYNEQDNKKSEEINENDQNNTYKINREKKSIDNTELDKLILDKNDSTYRSNSCSISMEISSNRPTSYNSTEYPIELNVVQNKRSTPEFRMKVNSNKNLSFSSTRMREIERNNRVLLQKILTQKSAYPAKAFVPKKINNIINKNNRQTSAAINRKKQQRQIDIDNQVLKRKLEAIAFRNRVH